MGIETEPVAIDLLKILQAVVLVGLSLGIGVVAGMINYAIKKDKEK